MPFGVAVMNKNVLRLKLFATALFKDLDNVDVFKIEFHLLEHIAEDVCLFLLFTF